MVLKNMDIDLPKLHKEKKCDELSVHLKTKILRSNSFKLQLISIATASSKFAFHIFGIYNVDTNSFGYTLKMSTHIPSIVCKIIKSYYTIKMLF